jgi:predicted SAM-dependent methyltransferase
VRRIPHADGSVDVVYTSHMVEHLDRDEAMQFLREARRVLRRGGILRIAVPDLRFHIDRYLEQHDADVFVEGVRLGRSRPKGLRRKIMSAIVGDREHHWMYDGPSLARLLAAAGFQDPRVMPSGMTTIPDPGALDLAERAPESVFVEATNP